MFSLLLLLLLTCSGQVADTLKKTPAQELSYADLIALAGAHAVAVCGGPAVDVPVGRVDAAGPDPGEH
jgi:L-ascorbate peroxidase